MIAIVTGASSGLGAEFCRALGSRVDGIWMVARRAEAMEELASGIGCPCRIIAADLTTPEGIGLLRSAVESERPDIGYLVNNAGFGTFSRTADMEPESIRAMVSLNVTALFEITSLCIPYMGPGSSIIEVCSASAYLPLPYLNVYASTKAAVRSFCDGLRPELRDARISVLEVSPGWIDTDFIPKAVSQQDVPEGVFKHRVTAKQVVGCALEDLAKGRRRSVCGIYNRFQVFVCRHLPSLASFIWMRSLGRR